MAGVRDEGGSMSRLRAIESSIEKLTQLKALLEDKAVMSAAEQAFFNPSTVTAPGQTHRAKNTDVTYGSLVAAVRAAALTFEIEECFTQSELADRVREQGHHVREGKGALHHSIQKLLVERIIEPVERGGGHRPNTFRRIGSESGSGHSENEQFEIAEEITEMVTTDPKQVPLRSELERVAFGCIAQFDSTFAPHQLVNATMKAGYKFVADPALGIQEFINKLVRRGVLRAVPTESGISPVLYEKADAK